MNINPEAKRVLVFGDSNTWGYIPNSKHERYSADIRYTGILQINLGSTYEIIEEGLNSRGIVNGDPRPGKEGRCSLDYIIPCLDTHDPIDIICVMLGTNELKYEFSNSEESIGEHIENLLKIILNHDSQFRSIKPQIILITPPLVNESTVYCQKDNKYIGALEKSQKLPTIYKDISEKLKIKFLDITELSNTGEDGIHLTEESHKQIGIALSKLIIET